MLGATIETFKGNRIIIIVMSLITLFIISVSITEEHQAGHSEYLALALIIISLFLLIYWLLSVEITIYTDGISSKTVLGKKEMRWENVIHFTYSATKQSVNFIPVGTYYSMKLEDAQGQKINIGNRASGKEKLSKQIINCTLLPLLSRAVEQYKSGAEVDFGLIKLNRARGFKSKGLFKSIEVPLNQLIDYRIEKGQFYVFRQGKKFAAISAPISKVPNAFALIALLDSMFKSKTPVS
jgi:hypothetical protein